MAGNGPIKVTFAKKKRVQILNGIKTANMPAPLRKSGSEGFVSQDPRDRNVGARALALPFLAAGLPAGSALPAHVTFTR